MANGTIILPPDSTGKKLRTRTLTEDGKEVHDEVVRLANSSDTEINPSTEDTLSALNGKVTTHNTHIKTIGICEAIGHGVTNGDITIERAMGRKTGIGTGRFRLLEEFDFVQPGGDTQMYIQSSSANDTNGGTGVNIVTIEYFCLAWGARKTTTVTMNGTNQVTLGVSDIYRVHKMYANKVGSNGVAYGDITLTNQAESTLYGEIAQYSNFMQRCIFYVAEGERLTCTEGIFGASTSGGVIGRLFATEENGDGNLVSKARIIFEVADSQIVYPFQISETVINPNNKKISMGIAVTGKTANQTATGTLKGFRHAISLC